jgi:hypothetical protein
LGQAPYSSKIGISEPRRMPILTGVPLGSTSATADEIAQILQPLDDRKVELCFNPSTEAR